MNDPVLVERHANILEIALNRPEAYNALNLDVMKMLGDALAYAAAEKTIQGVVLTGKGKAQIAFAAISQLTPAMLGALYWKQANRRGVLAGLATGALLWSYTLVLPLIAQRMDWQLGEFPGLEPRAARASSGTE